jgi:predicted ATP-dependent endonuclease of OLD family
MSSGIPYYRSSESSLLPIIGVNESGKTTILHALFAFDLYNDNSNDNGRHLKDISNLYRTSSEPATVAADIAITKDELLAFVHEGDVDAKLARQWRRKIADDLEKILKVFSCRRRWT